jgi:hypothetical protein
MVQCTEFSDVRKVERNPSPTEQQIRRSIIVNLMGCEEE